MNNFRATHCNAVNCTSHAVVASCATNTPPISQCLNNQIDNELISFYIGVMAYRKP